MVRRPLSEIVLDVDHYVASRLSYMNKFSFRSLLAASAITATRRRGLAGCRRPRGPQLLRHAHRLEREVPSPGSGTPKEQALLAHHSPLRRGQLRHAPCALVQPLCVVEPQQLELHVGGGDEVRWLRRPQPRGLHKHAICRLVLEVLVCAQPPLQGAEGVAASGRGAELAASRGGRLSV